MKSKHLTNDQLDRIANFDYHDLDEIREAWSRILEENLEGTPGNTVLDAGCGAGFLSILLARLGWEVTALDYSASILEKARENAARFQVEDRITFFHCDTTKTPLPEGSFHAIVSRNASSTFLEPVAVYREWYRLLQPGGTLLNFDANWLSPLWDEERSAQFLRDEEAVRREDENYWDIYHDRFALMKLSQYPLSYTQRPQWDEEICRAIGYSQVSARFLPDTGIRPPLMAQRFRIIPSFAVKAVK